MALKCTDRAIQRQGILHLLSLVYYPDRGCCYNAIVSGGNLSSLRRIPSHSLGFPSYHQCYCISFSWLPNADTHRLKGIARILTQAIDTISQPFPHTMHVMSQGECLVLRKAAGSLFLAVQAWWCMLG